MRSALACLIGFIFLPLLTGVLVAFSSMSRLMIHDDPAPLAGIPAASPAPPHDPEKLRALFVLSNAGVEVSEFLATYEVLAESGYIETYTAAPERKLSPTTARLAFLPQFSFADAPEAEILVIPSLLDWDNAEFARFLRERVPRAKFVLAQGEGVRPLVHADFLGGRSATTHFLALKDMRSLAPQTQWKADQRYVIDEPFITSAGISASTDAALALIEKLKGHGEADALATDLGLTWHEANDASEPSPALSADDLFAIFFHAGFNWDKKEVAVLLAPGASELGLAAPLDTFPRSHDLDITTLSLHRKLITTRHGLQLAAETDLDKPPFADLLIVPSAIATDDDSPPPADPLQDADLHRFTVDFSVAVKSLLFDLPGKAFTRSLEMIIDMEGPRAAGLAATMIAQPDASHVAKRPDPVGHRELSLFLRPLLLGLFGAFVGWLVERRWFRPLKPSVSA